MSVGARMTGGYLNTARNSFTDGDPSDGVIGKYRIIASRGEGGMGTVYLGVLAGGSGFHKLMVLKVVRSALLRIPTWLGCSSRRLAWQRD